MRLTYNQIIKLLRDFTENHYILKAFGNGEVWEMVQSCLNTDINYPMMWVEDQANTIQKGEELFNFRIYFLNQVATLKEKESNTLNETNINEVKSDMRQCASDLISYFAQDTNYPELTIDRNVSLTSFVDDTNDKLTGWYIDLRFKQAYTFNSCYLPMEGIAPPPSLSCEDGVITVNSISFSTVTSGGTENIIVKDTNGDTVGEKVGNEWIVPTGSITTPLKFRPYTGQSTEYQTYDDGYYFNNNYYNGGILLDFYNLSNNDLTPYSHNKRFTGNAGGYYNEVDGIYYNEDGTVSGSHSASFPDGLVLDHLTGYMWYYLTVGARNWSTAISEIQALTFKGFSDWTIPTKDDFVLIEDNELTTPLNSGIFSFTGNLWSSTTLKANILQAYYHNDLGETLRSNKTNAYFRVIKRKF